MYTPKRSENLPPVEEGSLKARVLAGDPIQVEYASLQETEADLQKRLAEKPIDMFFVDGQHSPIDEIRLVEFCTMADRLGAPVLFRIRHPEEVHMVGRYLDFGPLGIVVPQVETAQVAQKAIDAFYYPPLGVRGWGPGGAYRFAEHDDGLAYAQWWNTTGILMIQLESVAAVENAAALALPGIDMISFGAMDLSLSLNSVTDSPFADYEACRKHVLDVTKDSGIPISRSNMPLGTL